MPAYVIAEVDVHNPEGYKEYTDHTPGTIERAGGHFIVRGGALEVKEGEAPSRVVVIEFPDMAAAEAWYDSEEYQKLIPVRQANSTNKRFFIVEGV